MASFTGTITKSSFKYNPKFITDEEMELFASKLQRFNELVFDNKLSLDNTPSLLPSAVKSVIGNIQGKSSGKYGKIIDDIIFYFELSEGNELVDSKNIASSILEGYSKGNGYSSIGYNHNFYKLMKESERLLKMLVEYDGSMNKTYYVGFYYSAEVPKI